MSEGTRDPGLAAERTALARRRTTIPFLVVALLGTRVALEVPGRGLLVVAVACAGALAVSRSPGTVTMLVLLLAAAALSLPPVT